MKNLKKILKEYSSAIIIFLTLVILLVLINIYPKSLKDASDSLNRLRQTLSTGFIQDFNQGIIMNPEIIYETLEQFDTTYSGQSGKEFEIVLSTLLWTLGEYKDENRPEINRSLALSAQKQLQNMMDVYMDILNKRFDAFDSLFYFISIGVLIQFVYLVFALQKVKYTLNKLHSSEYNFFDFQKIREQERRNIASFLHDSILQDLGSILMAPQVSESEEVRSNLENTINQLRNLTYSTAPLQLYSLGLKESVIDLITNFQKDSGIIIHFHLMGFNDTILKDDVLLIFFRVIQEALNNIKKHSGALYGEIRIVESFPYVIMTIKDDGSGIDESKKRIDGAGNHFGLRLMEQQVRSIGGELNVISVPDEGTTIKMNYKLTDGEINE